LGNFCYAQKRSTLNDQSGTYLTAHKLTYKLITPSHALDAIEEIYNKDTIEILIVSFLDCIQTKSMNWLEKLQQASLGPFLWLILSLQISFVRRGDKRRLSQVLRPTYHR
jgi:hypothetical protein